MVRAAPRRLQLAAGPLADNPGPALTRLPERPVRHRYPRSERTRAQPAGPVALWDALAAQTVAAAAAWLCGWRGTAAGRDSRERPPVQSGLGCRVQVQSSRKAAVPVPHARDTAMTSTDENADRKVPGLLDVLALVPDPRKRRGRRFRLVFILAVAVTCALAGARNFREAGDHAADLPQEVLKRIGGRPHPLLPRIIAPHTSVGSVMPNSVRCVAA